MKTKKIIANIIIAGSLVISGSCQKWTESSPIHPTNLTRSNFSEEYYKNLREYKKAKHPVAFGWFGNWTGVGSSMQGSLMGLPDSTDFVSLWAPWFNPTPEMLRDLKEVQTIKGTKALMCDLIFDIGGKLNSAIEKTLPEGANVEEEIYKYWGWSNERTPEGLKKRQEAVRKYATALCDMMDKYGYDGFDIDAEPSYAQPFATKRELWEPGVPAAEKTLMKIFIETIGERCGPMAKTEEGRRRLFVIDGEPEAVPAECGKYFNYFILQAYYDGYRPGSYRIESLLDHYGSVMSVQEICEKTVYTCNFESFAEDGGAVHGQILGYATHKHQIDGKEYGIGGVGTYHMEYEYATKISEPSIEGIDMSSVKGKTYPWLRRAIQLMNPANNQKSDKK